MKDERNISPKISVVIPVFNVEHFIEETIKSVLQQSFSDFELILVNDGSTDTSGGICEEYEKLDARIKYISQDNLGASVARNNGIKAAQGEYIYFMDSDDTIDSLLLESSLNKAIEGNSDFTVVGDYFYKRMILTVAVPTCAQFIKARFLQNHSEIRFPENIQPCEDGLFSHQLLLLTDKVNYNREGIYFYRKHENQNHANLDQQADKVLQQIPKWLGILKDFYTEHDFFKSKALYLALFMQHEPFGIRYLRMKLTDQQKFQLHKVIRDFMLEFVVPNLSKNDEKQLSSLFVRFYKTENHKFFDEYFIASPYNKENKKLNKFYKKLTKFIPIKSIRRRQRFYLLGDF